MGIFHDIFRTRSTQIETPVLGILDLMSGEAEPEIESDSRALFHYFPSWTTSRKAPQSCDLLMLYARVNHDGTIDGSVQSLREIIRSSGASVVIIATDNPPDHYFEAVDETGYGQANLVLTIDRNGEAFDTFFEKLFDAMFHGETMPVAWNRLAPPVPEIRQERAPNTVFICERGQICYG